MRANPCILWGLAVILIWLTGCETKTPPDPVVNNAPTGPAITCDLTPGTMFYFEHFGGVGGWRKTSLLIHQEDSKTIPDTITTLKQAKVKTISQEEMQALHQKLKDIGVFEMRSFNTNWMDGFTYTIQIHTGDGRLCHELVIPIEPDHPSPHVDKLRPLFEELEQRYGPTGRH